MPSSSIPITDAFDETDLLESLEVALTPQQIAWLKDTAAERGLSTDHMLRALLNAQMRTEERSAAPAASGDGRRLDGVPDVSGGTAFPNGHDEAAAASTDEGTSMFDMMNE
jgi:plasmid stability protein